jgi:hypothetical protein
MRNEYNLRLVSRPNAAIRRIEQRLRELSWKKHPKIHEKEKIFVGRNELIQAFEQRIDDISRPTPACVFAAGLRKIGRRALLRHALRKTNIIDSSYEPLRIYLSQDDGIEGFILKIYDFGISEEHDLSGMLTKTVAEKTATAISICRQIANARDVVIIEDDGSIVDYEGQVASWFLELLSALNLNKMLFAVATSCRILC